MVDTCKRGGVDLNDSATRCEALHAIPADSDRESWLRVLMAAKVAGISEDDAQAWSAQADNYDASAFRSTWRSIKTSGGVGAGTLIYLAKQHGWRAPRGVTLERPAKPLPRPVETPVDPARTMAYVESIRRNLRPLPGTPSADYLTARGCPLPPLDGDLRHHDGLRHESGNTWPAMVGIITNILTGENMGLHRTFNIGAAGKAPTDKAKMVIGPKKGGAIRLWPDEAVTTGLAVAEGIETALSLAHAYRPVWSLIDAGNLAAFPVLPGIECLVIGADHDPAGLKAATACADRWAAAGVDVRVIVPETAGADWNDAEVAAA